MKINKHHIAQRFEKAGQSYVQHAVVQQHICQQLMQLMHKHLPNQAYPRVFEIGCGSGNLSHLLMQNFQIEQLFLNDLYAQVQVHFSDHQPIHWLIGDIEQLDFPEGLDLIASSSALQWMGDLEAVFQQCFNALNPQGYFSFSSFGPENLTEIKALTGQGLDYFRLEQIQEKLLQQGFEILHCSERIEKLMFQHPKEVLQHLKATGVTATVSRHRWTKHSLQQFYQQYKQFSQFDQAGQSYYPLTYHPIYCIARRKP